MNDKDKDLIVKTIVTLNDNMSKPVELGKVQKAVENVLDASEYFTGYEITVTVESRWKDNKAGN